MTTSRDDVDIPDPETAPPPPPPDRSVYDPGGDAPLGEAQPELAEDPAYDPGGMGRQPDPAEDAEDHG
jgi:hypothetical protein